MPKITKEQALALSESFRDTAVEIGAYRFAHWSDLKPAARQTLEDEEWTLLNYSSDFITKAVGIALDDASGSLEELEAAVDEAAQVIENIQTAKKVIELAGALVGLGAAIATKDPGAIVTALRSMVDIVKEIQDGQE